MMEYGLIGERLGHSYSPQIHRCFGDYDYQLYPMPKAELEAVLKSRQFKGLNITIPYKRDMLPFCDEISPTVRAVGSANTLVLQNGRLVAENTDLPGFLTMLEKGGIALTGKKVAILGSGGTSLTAQAVCRALHARETVVVSRQGPVTYETLYAQHGDIQVLINATPVGMYPGNLVSPVDIAAFPQLSGVADVIYNPARTALLLDARARGIPCVDGLWMLVAQAWHAARLFLGQEIPPEKMEEAYRAVRQGCLNLVLIGMPGSGKTTLGRMAAQALGKKFVDLDAEIARQAGPIPEIFARQGEAAFRQLESEAAARFGKESGLVIATGGGAILREENVRALSQNGVLAWVKRPVEQLSTAGRPLSTGPEALRRMEQARMPLYRTAANFEVENEDTVKQALSRLTEGFYEAAGH